MPDAALIALFLVAAAYAALVAGLLRARPLATAVGVLAGFAAALALAHLHLIAMIAFVAALTWIAAFVLIRPDDQRSAVLASGLTVLVVGASLFVSYLAPVAFVVTVGTYLLARRRLRLRTRPALVLMGGTLTALLGLAGFAFAVALTRM